MFEIIVGLALLPLALVTGITILALPFYLLGAMFELVQMLINYVKEKI